MARPDSTVTVQGLGHKPGWLPLSKAQAKASRAHAPDQAILEAFFPPLLVKSFPSTATLLLTSTRKSVLLCSIGESLPGK